jgi:hypothetical protein
MTATNMSTQTQIKLDPAAVKDAILNAASENEAVMAIFKMVYPEWDNIASVDGMPKCSEATWKAICNHFIELGNRCNQARPITKHVMPGGPWLNYGFSAVPYLREWWVEPVPVTMVKEVEA